MSVLDKLTEGIVNRNLQKEGTALLNKWEKTGLLEGLDNDNTKTAMSRLLENQAKELLRESSSMAAGDVQGFAAVAFPIVRRVFGSLVANELVSVQPMSLPSGLIFFLDFTFSNARLDQGQNTSIYGGGVVGSQLTGGVDLKQSHAERSFYALNNGYSSPTGSANVGAFHQIATGVPGSNAGDDAGSESGANTVTNYALGLGSVTTNLSELVRYDPDLVGKNVSVWAGQPSALDGAINRNNFITLSPDTAFAQGRLVRRLTTLKGQTAASYDDNINKLLPATASVLLVFEGTASSGETDLETLEQMLLEHSKVLLHGVLKVQTIKLHNLSMAMLLM